MLIAIIGENCVGKSTLAAKLNETFHAKLFSGKDYLRLEKNPSMALHRFKEMLNESVTGSNIIYIITEKEHLDLLPEDAVRIVVTAELSVIKERFRKRMNGNLPLPLEKKLEANHGIYDDLNCTCKVESDCDIDTLLRHIGAI